MPATSAVPLRRRIAALVVGAALAVPVALAQTAPPAAPAPSAAPAPADVAAVKKVLEQKFPGADIRYIAKSPYFGLYEAVLGDQMIYTDKKADQILVGSVYDTTAKTNLTEAKMRRLNRVDIAKLPMELALKKVKGNGSRKLIVFSDADCPFCHRLESEMKNLDNVTIYTFLFPIDQLHPDAANKSRKIWCAPDKVKAWDEFFASGKVPDNAGDCGDPVDKTQALGNALKVNATPTLIFADGTMMPGALQLAQIEKEMAAADAEVKKIAATAK
ncbi:MAG: DsbC family protein [Casimicrobiaceae bacterium]